MITCGSLKTRLASSKADAVFRDIGAILALVPLETHRHPIHSSIYSVATTKGISRFQRGSVGLRNGTPSEGTLTRLTETTVNPRSIWTPDGKHLTFLAAPGGALNIYWMPVDGSGLRSVSPQAKTSSYRAPGLPMGECSPFRKRIQRLGGTPGCWNSKATARRGPFSKRRIMNTRQRYIV